jgi:hypothetical protein
MAKPTSYVLGERHRAGTGPWHHHATAQLVYASEGVIVVRTRAGMWVVPPERGVWIPRDVEHRVSSRNGYELRTLFTDLAALDRTMVVAIDPLVRELLVAAAEFGAK